MGQKHAFTTVLGLDLKLNLKFFKNNYLMVQAVGFLFIRLSVNYRNGYQIIILSSMSFEIIFKNASFGKQGLL